MHTGQVTLHERIELLKDKANYNPSKLADKVLVGDHRTAHVWWSNIKSGSKIKGWSKEDVFNAHALIVKEFGKRGIEHTTPLLLSAGLGYDQPIRSSERDGEAKGEMLFLPSIIKSFEGDFMICEDFVTVVGGLCTHGSTRGDIDILLKCKEPRDNSSPLGMATKFRIQRALERSNIKGDRIEFLYDNFSGPFTSHVHVFDLVLKLKPQRDLHTMQELAKKSVTPFSFMIQPKPIHGRFKEQIYSTDTVVEVIESLPRWKNALANEGVFVETKVSGFRIQAHKVGKKVIIFTEENNDVTSKLPSLVKALQKIKHNFVVEGEVEHWMQGKKQSRADTVSIIHSKGTSPHEKHVILTLYDLVWLDGKDIHELPFKERIQKLGTGFSSSGMIKITKGKIVKTLDGIKSEVSKAAKVDGNEGAMIKMASYIYPLTPHTSQMIKFKNELSVNVNVVGVHNVKGTKTKNYLTSIRDGGKNIPMGRSFNTNIDAGVGDKIKIVFAELSKYIDPDTKEIWYNLWSPRVIEKVKSADSAATVESLVNKSGRDVEEKTFPTRYKELLDEDLYVSEFLKHALLWDTEEFEFALSNGWIKGNLIPDSLTATHLTELRNSDNFLIKKQIEDKALICLRNKDNEIETQKIVSLVEV